MLRVIVGKLNHVTRATPLEQTRARKSIPQVNLALQTENERQDIVMLKENKSNSVTDNIYSRSELDNSMREIYIAIVNDKMKHLSLHHLKCLNSFINGIMKKE